MNTCGCRDCTGRVKECKNYIGFKQVKMFEKVKPIAPRELSFKDYGITQERYRELRMFCQCRQNDDVTRSAAFTACPEIAEYILLSVRKNKSYESIEFDRKLGRIPCGRTDFYGYRRLFYHLLDQKLK